MTNKYQYPPTRLAWAGSILAGLLLFGGNPVYADRYVATNGANALPYDLWTRAATNIQDAVNVAVDGETVWVSNGTYFCQGVTPCIHSYYYSYWGANYPIVTNMAMVAITMSKLIRNVLILDSLEMSPFCCQHVVALARVPPPENGLI